MIHTFRTELRKLLTIRSTYIISLLSIAFVVFMSFYVTGVKGESGAFDTYRIETLLYNIASLLGVFGAIVAVLLIGHEYRYNTIMYTLTSSNSRTKVFVAKLAVALLYAGSLVTLGSLIGIVAQYAGASVGGYTLTVQTIDWGSLLWRMAFYASSFALLGLALGFLFRNVVPAMVSIFIVPSTVEPLLGLLLKENSKYLPFGSLTQVISAPGNDTALSPGHAAAVAALYVVGAMLIAWYLFLQRDAN